jgi:hypothetical protein
MSTLNHEQIAVIVRRRLGLEPDAVLRIEPVIGNALNALAIRVAGNYKLRQWLLTDPSAVTVTLDSDGNADLSTIITSNNILIEYIRYGNVYHADSSYPLQWLETLDQLRTPGPYDAMFLHCSLVGTTLYTRSFDDNVTPLTGDLGFAIPYVPTLSQLPESLTDDLVSTVVSMMETPKAA